MGSITVYSNMTFCFFGELSQYRYSYQICECVVTCHTDDYRTNTHIHESRQISNKLRTRHVKNRIAPVQIHYIYCCLLRALCAERGMVQYDGIVRRDIIKTPTLGSTVLSIRSAPSLNMKKSYR